jgi:voltage-gated potassium channel Kch
MTRKKFFMTKSSSKIKKQKKIASKVVLNSVYASTPVKVSVAKKAPAKKRASGPVADTKATQDIKSPTEKALATAVVKHGKTKDQLVVAKEKAAMAKSVKAKATALAKAAVLVKAVREAKAVVVATTADFKAYKALLPLKKFTEEIPVNRAAYQAKVMAKATARAEKEIAAFTKKLESKSNKALGLLLVAFDQKQQRTLRALKAKQAIKTK